MSVSQVKKANSSADTDAMTNPLGRIARQRSRYEIVSVADVWRIRDGVTYRLCVVRFRDGRTERRCVRDDLVELELSAVAA